MHLCAKVKDQGWVFSWIAVDLSFWSHGLLMNLELISLVDWVNSKLPGTFLSLQSISFCFPTLPHSFTLTNLSHHLPLCPAPTPHPVRGGLYMWNQSHHAFFFSPREDRDTILGPHAYTISTYWATFPARIAEFSLIFCSVSVPTFVTVSLSFSVSSPLCLATNLLCYEYCMLVYCSLKTVPASESLLNLCWTLKLKCTS